MEDPEVLVSPAREHADRDHAARADAEAAGGARVDQHFAWPGGIGEAAREHLRTVEGHAVPAVDVHQELDGLRPEEAHRPVLRVPGAVGKEAGDGRGLDIWTGSDLLDRPLVGRVVGAGIARVEPRVREAVRDEVALECRVGAARACRSREHGAARDPGEHRHHEPAAPARAELAPEPQPDGGHSGP